SRRGGRHRPLPVEPGELLEGHPPTADREGGNPLRHRRLRYGEYAPRRFPRKTVKRVGSGIRPRSIDGFLFGLKLTFQPGKAATLNAVYHFTFTGEEPKQATVVIRDG